MPLYERSNRAASDWLPSLDFLAATGEWSIYEYEMRERVKIAGWAAIIDFQYPRTAWGLITTGQAPDFVFDKIAGKADPQPGPKYRRALAVVVYSREYLGGLREIRTTNPGLCAALSDLHEIYEGSPEAKKGLLPVVETGTPVEYTTRNGVFYDATLTIIDWTPRPAEIPVPPPSRPNPVAGSHIRGLDLDDDIPF